MGIYIKGVDFYPALVTREGRMFQARFIDVPSCVVFGESAIDAEIKAGEALGVYADHLRRCGGAMPSPGVVCGESNHRNRYVAYIKAPTRPLDLHTHHLAALIEPRAIKEAAVRI